MTLSNSGGWTIYESPLGPLTLSAGPRGVRSLRFPEGAPRLDEAERRPMPEATAQLDEYFGGERRDFELDLDLVGTPFQRLVWAQLRLIPFGTTVSYGELAERVEQDAFPDHLEPYQRVRFAAGAVGRTPVPILIPCHRVIGANGSLTGYGGGLERKRALLDLEREVATGATPEPEWDARQQALL